MVCWQSWEFGESSQHCKLWGISSRTCWRLLSSICSDQICQSVVNIWTLWWFFQQTLIWYGLLLWVQIFFRTSRLGSREPFTSNTSCPVSVEPSRWNTKLVKTASAFVFLSFSPNETDLIWSIVVSNWWTTLSDTTTVNRKTMQKFDNYKSTIYEQIIQYKRECNINSNEKIVT